jgi:hypothetical protein
VAAHPGGHVPLGLLTLIAGLVAGTLSWLGGEFSPTLFPVVIQIPPDVARLGGYERSAAMSAVVGRAQRIAQRKQTAAAYGMLGAILGAALGGAGGLARGAPGAGLRAAVAGGATAAAVGAGLSLVLVPLFYTLKAAAEAAQYSHPDSPTGIYVIHFLTHGAIAAGVGAVCGAALGWGLRNRASLGRAFIGGLFGAVAGVFLFETINALVFPLVIADAPLSEERLPRLVMHLSVAAAAALLAGLAATERRRASASSGVAR